MTGSAPSTLKSRPDYRMSRASIKPLQELFLVARGLISLKDYTKFNCVGGWIMIAKLTVMPSILCYRLGHWLGKNGILELGIGTAGYILVKLTLLKLQVTPIPLPVEVSCPLISEETSFPLLENSMLTSSGADVLKEDAPSQDPPQPALVTISLCVPAKLLQSCLTFCEPMDCGLPGSSVHEILQARILERIAMLSSRRSSQLRDWTCISCIGRQILDH